VNHCVQPPKQRLAIESFVYHTLVSIYHNMDYLRHSKLTFTVQLWSALPFVDCLTNVDEMLLELGDDSEWLTKVVDQKLRVLNVQEFIHTELMQQ
jgi:hypothetical protein